MKSISFQGKIMSGMGFLLVFCLMASTANAQIPTDGIVAYWSFDNCDAADESGNGYDGTVYGNPECEDGVNGLALRFDGVNDHIQLNQTLDTNVVKAFSFWINSNGVDGVNNNGAVIGKYNWDDRKNFNISSHGNKEDLGNNYIRAYFYKYIEENLTGDFLNSYYGTGSF